MSGLSLMQTRSFIDKLGDLDEEITKVCRAADVMAKGASNHTDGVGRLKEACTALEEKQQYIREAKDCLLGLDGFMHALSGEMRQLMDHPTMGGSIGRISERMQNPMSQHVAAMVEDTVSCLRRVGGAVKDLREAKDEDQRSGDLKANAKALAKICGAAEKALHKAVQYASKPAAQPEAVPAEEVVVEEVADKAAGDVGFHGYTLTAGLPKEFLENIKDKKDEAKGKKDDDKADDKDEKKGGKSAHGYDLIAGELPDFIKEKMKDKDDQDEAADKDDDEKAAKKKADSLTPGNESKGPKDEGEENEGWVPGHKTDGKKAKGKVPEAFLKNIEKMKAKGKGKGKDDAKGDDKDDAKDSGKPWEKGKKDESKKAGYHGYTLTDASEQDYDLFA